MPFTPFINDLNCMKKIVLIAVIGLISMSVQAQKINWMSFNEALEAQKESPKKIMVDAYTIWCGPCKMLDKNTFQNADVANYINKNYYAVKFNAEGNEKVIYKDREFGNPNYQPEKSGRNSQHELAMAMRIGAYPTIIFMNETGDVIAPIPGYKTPQQLEVYLKLFYTDSYLKIDSKEKFQEYVNSLKLEFEGE